MPSTIRENKTPEQTFVNNIIKEFADALKIKDFLTIEKLLSDNGTFQISMPNAERISVSKSDYTIYLLKLVEDAKIDSFTYDQCLYCNAGARVILFNEGRFPFNDLKNQDKREKTGFMLAVTDGRINEIKYCYSFLKNDNRSQMDVNGDRIKQLMNDNGWDFDKAYASIFKKDLPADRVTTSPKIPQYFVVIELLEENLGYLCKDSFRYEFSKNGAQTIFDSIKNNTSPTKTLKLDKFITYDLNKYDFGNKKTRFNLSEASYSVYLIADDPLDLTIKELLAGRYR